MQSQDGDHLGLVDIQSDSSSGSLASFEEEEIKVMDP